MLYPRKCFGILQFYVCLAFFIESLAFSFSYTFFCLSSFMYSWLASLPQSVLLMFYYSKLWECMLQKPLVPTPCCSDDCNQIWPWSGTSAWAGYGMLENKVQLWLILSCVIRRFLCPKILWLKLMHIYTDDHGTSIPWRHNHKRFSNTSRNTCRRLQGPSQLSTPFYS